jgi:hypothetical protein
MDDDTEVVSWDDPLMDVTLVASWEFRKNRKEHAMGQNAMSQTCLESMDFGYSRNGVFARGQSCSGVTGQAKSNRVGMVGSCQVPPPSCSILQAAVVTAQKELAAVRADRHCCL